LVFAPLWHKVWPKIGKCIKNADGVAGQWAQDNFIATPENFDSIDIETEFLGEADCLTVARLEDSGG
jgi:hypothetical protein